MIVKILNWLRVNGAGFIGIAQVAIKLVKEILTAIVNILFPLFPDNGSFEKTIMTIREWVNKIDDVVETIKDWLLKI